MPDIDIYQCDLLGSGAFGEGNYLASKTTSVDTCSLNSTLKYFPTSRRIFQIHSFLLILFLGIWWKLRSGYLSLFPLQPGIQQCSLPGILPVCLCVHTSIVARQLPGEGCWKPGQSPQVGLALGSGMWSLHKIWESPIHCICTQWNATLSFMESLSCINQHKLQ